MAATRLTAPQQREHCTKLFDDLLHAFEEGDHKLGENLLFSVHWLVWLRLRWFFFCTENIFVCVVVVCVVCVPVCVCVCAMVCVCVCLRACVRVCVLCLRCVWLFFLWIGGFYEERCFFLTYSPWWSSRAGIQNPRSFKTQIFHVQFWRYYRSGGKPALNCWGRVWRGLWLCFIFSR